MTLTSQEFAFISGLVRRDAAIVHGLDELRGMRAAETKSLFVVLGPSGTGKSSFLRAGLLPRLAREDRRFALLGIVRPGRNALTGDAGLAAAIWHARDKLGLSKPSLGDIKTACHGDIERIRELLIEIQQKATDRLPDPASGDERPAPPTLILPLDQAEELFSADAGVQGAELMSFVRQLTVRTDLQPLSLIVVATIRTDRYEVMQTHPELVGECSIYAKRLFAERVGYFSSLRKLTEERGRLSRRSAAEIEGDRISIDPLLVEAEPIGRRNVSKRTLEPRVQHS